MPVDREWPVGSEGDMIEFEILDIMTRYGGERIISGPAMDRMRADITRYILGKITDARRDK